MPELSNKLKIPKPLGNEVVSREAFNNIFDQIDTAAASQADLDAHKSATDPHPQYATDGDLNSHKTAAVLDHPDGSVTTAKLANGAVTAEKVGSDVATKAQLDAHAGSGGAAHPSAIAGGAAGFMNGADKSKLDGATSNVTSNAIMQRDSNGRAQVASPAVTNDIANMGYVDGIRADSAKSLVIEVRTSDPVSPAVGRMWVRSDL
ncbi:hypothetical protein [Paenibacillus thalictri]|uniref:Uncharacterized protein n=1 Tax=Paenibacillus thalictri TaxID=2527873 RepID=A0A4Q9DGE7_9BACL|nr:hypothetical protein [Paenibacillus thalictri]TBL71367.1 hypothetical protein EYB31_30205 [Paenibacillus thalictri]